MATVAILPIPTMAKPAARYSVYSEARPQIVVAVEARSFADAAAAFLETDAAADAVGVVTVVITDDTTGDQLSLALDVD
jgi:hypothetical protein